MSEPAGNERRIAILISVAFFALWEISARAGWISSFVFPPPSLILSDFPRLWTEGLMENLTATLRRYFGGMVVGSIPGIALGLAVGSSTRMRRLVDPFIYAIHPVPKIVLFPLFIVMFGIGETPKLVSVALAVFFPTFINAAAGARQIPPLHFEVIRNYGGGRRATIRHVILPGSLPMVLTGLRIAANTGLTVTISIEFAMAAPGIGSILWLSWQTMRTENLYAAVFMIATIGFVVNWLLQNVLQRVAAWQPAR